MVSAKWRKKIDFYYFLILYLKNKTKNKIFYLLKKIQKYVKSENKLNRAVTFTLDTEIMESHKKLTKSKKVTLRNIGGKKSRRQPI